jgi:hypothetical protein
MSFVCPHLRCRRFYGKSGSQDKLPSVGCELSGFVQPLRSFLVEFSHHKGSECEPFRLGRAYLRLVASTGFPTLRIGRKRLQMFDATLSSLQRLAILTGCVVEPQLFFEFL